MEDVEIRYSVSFDDYARAADLLRRKSHFPWRSVSFHLLMAAFIFLVLIGYRQRYGDLDVLWILLLPPGGYFLFVVGLHMLPYPLNRFWLKRIYIPSPVSEISSVRFSADRVIVTGGTQQWSHRWTAFHKVEENAEMFVLSDKTAVFIFAKRFFTPEQIGGLQELIRNRPAGNEPS